MVLKTIQPKKNINEMQGMARKFIMVLFLALA